MMTSLTLCFPVSPIYQRYNQTSGEIENYTEDDYANGRHQDVYLYYRCTYSNKMLSALQNGNGQLGDTTSIL